MPSQPNSTHLRLPIERHAKLKQIAASLGDGSTLGDAFAAMLRSYIDAGNVDHEIPGVSVNAFHDGLAIGFDDRLPVALSRAQAEKLARAIDALTTGGERPVIDVDQPWSVSRCGNGYVIGLSDGSRKVWARDVAEDFVWLIQRALASVPARAA